MKKFVLGFVIGATLSGVGVKAHDTINDEDDLMKIAKRIESRLNDVEAGIFIWCGDQK
jgi:hypothetical protein